MEKIWNVTERFLENKDGIKVRRIKFNKNALLHSHNFYEMELVLSGGGEQILNGTSYEMKRGSLSILTPADFHEFSCFGEIEILGVYCIRGERTARTAFLTNGTRSSVLRGQ